MHFFTKIATFLLFSGKTTLKFYKTKQKCLKCDKFYEKGNFKKLILQRKMQKLWNEKTFSCINDKNPESSRVFFLKNI
jgi:hypothetical protein